MVDFFSLANRESCFIYPSVRIEIVRINVVVKKMVEKNENEKYMIKYVIEVLRHPNNGFMANFQGSGCAVSINKHSCLFAFNKSYVKEEMKSFYDKKKKRDRRSSGNWEQEGVRNSPSDQISSPQ